MRETLQFLPKDIVNMIVRLSIPVVLHLGRMAAFDRTRCPFLFYSTSFQVVRYISTSGNGQLRVKSYAGLEFEDDPSAFFVAVPGSSSIPYLSITYIFESLTD